MIRSWMKDEGLDIYMTFAAFMYVHFYILGLDVVSWLHQLWFFFWWGGGIEGALIIILFMDVDISY